jgi:hypothetical protein
MILAMAGSKEVDVEVDVEAVDKVISMLLF